MAKKIKTDDLFEGDLFAKQIQSAKDYSLVLAEIIKTQKDLLIVTKQQLKENPIGSAKDVQAMGEQTKAIEKTTSSIKVLEKAEKELEKQRLAEIKLQKEREKAFDSFNKQQEKNFELQKKQNSVYSQSVERLRGLKAQLKELEITGRTNGKLYKALGQEFVVLNGKVRDAEEGVGEFFRNVGNYPQQLKALQKELQGLEPGSAKFNELAARAGVLKDKINDAKDATKAFATESKFQTAKTLFSQIGDDLKNADFVGAADKAKQLSSVIKSITFAEAAEQIKNFGSAIFNLGKSLLLNPFTIIVAGVAAVVAIFYKWNEVLEQNNKTLADSEEAINKQKEAIDSLNESINNTVKARLEEQGVITKSQSSILSLQEKLQESSDKIKAKEIESITRLAQGFQLSEDAIKNNAKEITKTTGLSVNAINKLASLSDTPFYLKNITFQRKQTELFLQQLSKEYSGFNSEKRKLEEDYNEAVKLLYDKDVSENKKANQQKAKDNKKAKDATILKGSLDETDFVIKQKQEENDALFNLALEEAAKEVELKRQADQEAFDNAKKLREKQRKEVFDFVNTLTDKTIQEINKRKEAEINAKQDEIDNRKSSLQVQQDLAARGLSNTLAFEKEQLAKAEQEKARLAKEQEKREKRQVFLKALIANLESAKTQDDVASAFAKSIAITALAETFAGSFKDGVEGLDGKGTATSDSNLALLSKGESVVTAKGTNKYSGLATAMNKGNAEKWFMENLQPNVVHNEFDSFVLGKKLDQINKTLQSQEKIKIHWDSHDARVESMVKDGYKKTIKHVRSKPRI